MKSYILIVLCLISLGMCSGACNNTADRKVLLEDHTPKEEYDFMHACGVKCLGKTSCLLSCDEGLGISVACAACYVANQECVQKNCWARCFTSGCKSTCYECIDKYCTDGFHSCTGMICPRYKC